MNMKISKADDFNINNAELAIHVINGQAEVTTEYASHVVYVPRTVQLPRLKL